MRRNFSYIVIAFSSAILFLSFILISDDDTKRKYRYADFQTPEYCKSCHSLFFQQWDQAMMSDAYTHHWDEIEYFDLAVPHAEIDPNMKEAQEGCNGCHTPLAYMADNLPPPRPDENSRANESVSCEACHLIQGYYGEEPYNHNYIIEPGQTKYTSRKGETQSPVHEIETTEIHSEAEFCAICHNEMSPFGTWVKSTYTELKDGPYYEEGVMCQDCHMTKAPAKTAKMGTKYKDAKLHLFHGAHDKGKLNGVVEIRITPDIREAVPGEPVIYTIALFNQKTGHKFPTGSVEDRILWLHVEAVDEKGNIYHLPVDKKGFEGEEYTIAGEELAYQDLAIPLQLENFEGLRREDVPAGDRIFRMPFFDPLGRMTIMQWNTDSLGVDYRLGPRETKLETYTFNVPYDIATGKLTVRAEMKYRLLVKPVGEYLNVPEEEYQAYVINTQSTSITILP